eukprot:TRINITY_DN12601_c0_g2_i1.p2 TRINITY_DN12601_c0_g2~~TRINITY_DN12601_c0_g2_i1.p2  ORF type:complete len:105 (-),score=4.68 TRINITY_DN12601_c0_g2_i1:10-324(-)
MLCRMWYHVTAYLTAIQGACDGTKANNPDRCMQVFLGVVWSQLWLKQTPARIMLENILWHTAHVTSAPQLLQVMSMPSKYGKKHYCRISSFAGDTAAVMSGSDY